MYPVIDWSVCICRRETKTNVIMNLIFCVISLGILDFNYISLILGVKAVFSGHYHRNAGGCYDGLDMVVSSAVGCQLGDDTHGVRVVVVTEEDIIHRYHSLDQLTERGMDEDLNKLLVWIHLRITNHLVVSSSSAFIIEPKPLFVHLELSGLFFTGRKRALSSEYISKH